MTFEQVLEWNRLRDIFGCILRCSYDIFITYVCENENVLIYIYMRVYIFIYIYVNICVNLTMYIYLYL